MRLMIYTGATVYYRLGSIPSVATLSTFLASLPRPVRSFVSFWRALLERLVSKLPSDFAI